MAASVWYRRWLAALGEQIRREQTAGRGAVIKVALHTSPPVVPASAYSRGKWQPPPGDRPEITRWWGEGTELAERLRALADLWRHQPGTTSYELIAIDLDGVLSGEWDPREQR
jgi:hypothetical protein